MITALLKSILDIIKGKKKGIVVGEFIDLAKLPWPARHLLPMEKYIKLNMPTSVYSPRSRVAQIETTRGCPFRYPGKRGRLDRRLLG